jgi:predicted ATPase
MIGLVGAQGVGKTTLAQAYAAKFGGTYLDASVTKIIRAAGYDPSAAGAYDFSTRLDLQAIVLSGCERIYASAPVGMTVITDRTPLDMLAYTLAEAIGNRVEDKDQDRLARYIADCFEVSNRYFSTILLLQPGIPLQEGRDGKAVANRAFVEHLNSLMLGLTVDPRLKTAHFYIPRSYLTVEERIAAVDSATRRIVEHAEQTLSVIHQAGGRVH